jgi:putative transposase
LQCVSTGTAQHKNKFGPQINNLSSIIRGFKGAVTKHTNMYYPHSLWQPKFYDHIIRNDETLNKIREYIIKNPEMWERNKNNIENIFI